MTPRVLTFTDAMHDPNLLGHAFPDLATWRPHLTIGRATFAEPPQPGDIELFAQLTGRDSWPTVPARNLTMITGRRSGKTRKAAALGVYLAIRQDYGSVLAPGERAVVACLAADRDQAQVLLSYVRAHFDAPMLRSMVVKETANSIELNNGAVIQVLTASFRALRGRTFKAVVCDEVAYWMLEGANPAAEIIAAATPGLLTLDGLLIKITSPYMEEGPVFDDFNNHFGVDGSRTLVVRAASRVMNSTLPQDVIDDALREDYEKAAAEYLAQWRSDLKAFLDQAKVNEALRDRDLDRPCSPHERPYRAFVDFSGGRKDSAALAISHMEPDSEEVIVDAVRRWQPPFSPEAVVREMAELLSQYRLTSCVGDDYAAEVLRELFTNAGVAYERSDDSASEIYLSVLPLFNTGRIAAPDNKVLRRELTALIRRTRQGGRDQVDHPRGGHDDLAVATCGSVLHAWRAKGADFLPVVTPRREAVNDGALTRGHEGASPWDLS